MKKYLIWILVLLVALLLVGCDQLGTPGEVNQETVEVVNETPDSEYSTEETDTEVDTEESDPAAEEAVSEEAPVVLEFVPIAIEDMGVTTVAPADWPKIEGDPLLKDAWGPGQYRFVAFHSVAGEDVQGAMAQLLGTTVEELDAGAMDGEYWTEEIGDKLWEMFEIDNPDVGLAQTVSMTGEQGNIYVVSLFVETAQKEAILTPVLENFTVEVVETTAESEEPETETAVEEETFDEAASALIDRSWALVARDDGSGQLVDVLSDVEITAVFAADGRVSGSAGCNDYATVYTVEGDKVTISAPAKTRKECANPAGIMDQETGFLDDLAAVGSFQISGDELQVLNEQGVVILVFLSS